MNKMPLKLKPQPLKRKEVHDSEDNAQINKFSMDDKGRIRKSGGTAVATAKNVRLFVVLGWISAGLVLISFSFYMSLLFASAGVLFGVLVSRQQKGMGTAIIATNLALVAFQLLLGLFFVAALKRIIGY
jgi:hypothetical protein